MKAWKAALLATRDMLVSPSVISTLVGDLAGRYISPKPRTDSPFLSLRGTDQSLRRNHAPYHQPLGMIPTSDKPQLVEYTIQEHEACFPASTLVLMADGYCQPIASIRTGDWIRRQDGSPGKVSRLWYNGPSSEWLLVKAGTQEVISTPSHKFWVRNIGWVPIGALEDLEGLTLEDGEICADGCELRIHEGMVAQTQGSTPRRQGVADRTLYQPRALAPGDSRDRRCNPRSIDQCNEKARDTYQEDQDKALNQQDQWVQQLELERRGVQWQDSRDHVATLQARLENLQEKGVQQGTKQMSEMWQEVQPGSASRHALEALPRTQLRRGTDDATLQAMPRRSRRHLYEDGGRVLQVTRLPRIYQGRYDLEIEGTHEYVANGFRVHNSRAGLHWDLRIHLEVDNDQPRVRELDSCTVLSRMVRSVPSLRRYNVKRDRQLRGVSYAVRRADWPALGKPILAVRQPDHDPEFSKFEGTIPDGQYGAGSVRIVSKGHAWVWHSDPDQISITFLDDDDTDRTMRCSLVRSGGDNWLWIRKRMDLPKQVDKHPFKSMKGLPHGYDSRACHSVQGQSGEMANGDRTERHHAFYRARGQTRESAIQRCIRGIECSSYGWRTPGAGENRQCKRMPRMWISQLISTVYVPLWQVQPGLLRILYKRRVAQLQYIAEEKVDGAWAIAYVKHGKVRAFSHRVSRRHGEIIEYTDKAPALHDGRLGDLGEGVFTVELYHPRGAAYLGGLLNTKSPGTGLSELQRHQGIQYKVLDILSYDESGRWHGDIYEDRRASMEDLSKQGVPVARQARPGQPIEDFYNEVTEYRRRDQVVNDGIVLKPRDSVESEKWFRVKPVDTRDCEVIGFTPGTGRHSRRLGALLVKNGNGKEIRVGTGFSDEQRDHIWAHQDAYLNQVIEVDFHQRKHQSDTGPRITKVPIFYRTHPSKSDLDLRDTAEGLGVSKYALIRR